MLYETANSLQLCACYAQKVFHGLFRNFANQTEYLVSPKPYFSKNLELLWKNIDFRKTCSQWLKLNVNSNRTCSSFLDMAILSQQAKFDMEFNQ